MGKSEHKRMTVRVTSDLYEAVHDVIDATPRAARPSLNALLIQWVRDGLAQYRAQLEAGHEPQP
jgi:hypothetical protein